MREIKFRCWSGEEIISPDYIDRFGYAHWKENSIPTMSKDIMQFTGLKDKAGTEIYEGDICRILYTDWPSNTDPDISLEDYLASISHIGEIAYEAPVFGILLKNRYDEHSLHSLDYGTHGCIEIIGNIYEHPNLLK